MSRIVNATIKATRPASQPPAPTARPLYLVPCSLPTSLWLDLLGRPFADGARGPASFDCVGLALEIAKRLGKTLPAFLSSEAELHAQLGTGNATLADLPQIARAVPGCIVLFRISPTQHHVAVMVDENRMIHTLAGINCTIERVNSNLWQRKVIGFYSL